MQSLYPLALADKSWDNVGLLLEPPKPRHRDPALRPSVLLTIDLTTAVAKEALAERSGIETIVSYRLSLWCRALTGGRSDNISRIEGFDNGGSAAGDVDGVVC